MGSFRVVPLVYLGLVLAMLAGSDSTLAQDECADLELPGLRLLADQPFTGPVTAAVAVGDSLYLAAGVSPRLLVGVPGSDGFVPVDTMAVPAPVSALAAAGGGRLAVGTTGGDVLVHERDEPGETFRIVDDLGGSITTLAWNGDVLGAAAGDSVRFYDLSGTDVIPLGTAVLPAAVRKLVACSGQFYAATETRLVRMSAADGFTPEQVERSDGHLDLACAGDLVYWQVVEDQGGCDYYPNYETREYLVHDGQALWHGTLLGTCHVSTWSDAAELLVAKGRHLHLVSVSRTGTVREIGGLALPVEAELVCRAGDRLVSFGDGRVLVVDAARPQAAGYVPTAISAPGSVVLGSGGLLWKRRICDDEYAGYVRYDDGHARTVVHIEARYHPDDHVYVQAVGDNVGVLFYAAGYRTGSRRIWIDLATGESVGQSVGGAEGDLLAVSDRYALWSLAGSDSLRLDSIEDLHDMFPLATILPAHPVERRTFAGDRLLLAASSGVLSIYDMTEAGTVTLAWTGDLGHAVAWLRCRDDVLLANDDVAGRLHVYRLGEDGPVPVGTIEGAFADAGVEESLLYLLGGDGYLSYYLLREGDVPLSLGGIATGTVDAIEVTAAGPLAVPDNLGQDGGTLCRVLPPCGIEVPVTVLDGEVAPAGDGWRVTWRLGRAVDPLAVRVTARAGDGPARSLAPHVTDRQVWAEDDRPADRSATVYALALLGDDGWRVVDELTAAPRPVRGLRLTVADHPAERTTEIHLAGVRDAGVRVGVYDLQGRLVRRLSGVPADGRLDLSWSWRDAAGRRMAAGIYLVRARQGDQVVARKVLVTR